MINLLPEQEKEQLILERKRKLVIVLGNIVLVSLIYLVLVLFALKFYILEKLVSQDIIASNAQEQYKNPEINSLKESIKVYNTSLIKANNFYKKEIYFADVLRFVTKIERPKGLYLTDMTLEVTKDGEKVKATLYGVSNNRENLQTFKNSIESKKNLDSGNKIENIYFPPDIWIKSKDLNFSVTFEILRNENKN